LLVSTEIDDRVEMASAAICDALTHFPDISACSTVLKEFISDSPPGSPVLGSRKRKGGHKSPSWPMPRALFILDEKRQPVGRKQACSIDELVDELGSEEASKLWDETQEMPVDKTLENELRHLCALLKIACRGLEQNDPAIMALADRLVAMLPDQGSLAAACLAPLAGACPGHAAALMAPVRSLLQQGETQVFTMYRIFARTGMSHYRIPSQVARRRAAIGFGSLLKGLGIGAIRQYSVMAFLDELGKDAGNPNGRQSGVFCYECLFRLYGYPFEPYVFRLAANIVASFDDQGECMAIYLPPPWVNRLMHACC